MEYEKLDDDLQRSRIEQRKIEEEYNQAVEERIYLNQEMQDLIENSHIQNFKCIEFEKLVKEFEYDKNIAEQEAHEQ